MTRCAMDIIAPSLFSKGLSRRIYIHSHFGVKVMNIKCDSSKALCKGSKGFGFFLFEVEKGY